MSNEGSADLARLLEERKRAAEKMAQEFTAQGIQVGDLLTVQYNNGMTETKTFNGWVESEGRPQHIKFGTGIVPPIYIVHFQKES